MKYLFARSEMKFFITEEQKNSIVDYIFEKTYADRHGESTVFSLYYDTPSFLLIRRSVEHPTYKEKFRLRCYGEMSDESEVFAEIKKKYKSVVYKRRICLSGLQADEFIKEPVLKGDNMTEKEISFFFSRYPSLAPRMLIMYDRTAFFGKDDKGLRITFDKNILYRDYDLNLRLGAYGERVIPEGYVLMEIKNDNAMPIWVCKMLSEMKIYKTSFSKYGKAYMKIIQKGDNTYA